ncbi:hypothetical protein [Tardiphaga sp.]|jgi:hypothetical protein|uniref:hypothetical protein n=1 Tax=Tardiphaga sp. TaxID=1926292 RepID=UPI0037DA17CA
MVAISSSRFGTRDAQPVDDFIGGAKDILKGLFGDADSKDLPVFAQAAIENTKRVREIAARKFGDAEGEELLEALCDAVLRRPTFITQLGMPPDQVLAQGQFREGMSATVFLLLAWIAEGRNEQPPQREGNHERSTRPKRARKPAAKRPRKR